MTRQDFHCQTCGAWFEGEGRAPRCPSCGSRVRSRQVERQEIAEQPLPSLPRTRSRRDVDLEGPAFLDTPRADKTAPWHEFVAAFVVMAGFGLIVAGAITSRGELFLIGLIVMFVTVAAFGIFSFIRTIRALVRAYNQDSRR